MTVFTGPLHAYSYDDIEKLQSKLEDKYSIKLYIKEIPFSIWDLDFDVVTEEDFDILYNYLLLFDEEFSKYPLEFLNKTRLKGVSFVRYLSFGGQVRTAVPDHIRELLFYDFARGRYDKTYQRHVIHHEFYHMIEDELNKLNYGKVADTTWLEFHKPDNPYGLGGASIQGNSNAFPFTHPEQGFVNLYSKSALGEDKSEVFAGLFIKEEYVKIMGWIKKDKILYNKVKFMKSFLKDQNTNFNDSYWNDLHNIVVN